MNKLTKLALGLVMVLLIACDQVNVEVITEGAPEVCNTLEPLTLKEGESSEQVTCFTDPEDERLSLSAVSSSDLIATAEMLGEVVSVTGQGEGQAEVTVTATDPGGLSADVSFTVLVEPAEDTISTPQSLLKDDFTSLSDGWEPQDVTAHGIEDGRLWIASDDKDKPAIFWHAVNTENPLIRARIENATDDFWSTLLMDMGDGRYIALVVGADISRMSNFPFQTNFLIMIYDANTKKWGAPFNLRETPHPAIPGPGTPMDVEFQFNGRDIEVRVNDRTIEYVDGLIGFPNSIVRIGIGGVWPDDKDATTDARVYFDEIEVATIAN